MVTALGVLGAALVKMQHYTVFEFQTIIYLAWMATNMHLSTLSILRTWFQSRPHLRAFRLFNMLALLVMMCIAIYPTTEYDWADHTVYDLGFCSSSHSCSGLTEKVDRHWQAARKQHRLVPQGVFAYAILIISHVWQSAMLFKKVHSSAHDRAQGLLKALGGALRPPIRNEPPEVSLRQIKYRLVIGIYMFFLAIIEILGSWAFVQFLVGTHLAWSSFQLFVPRFILLPSCVAAELNNWNFGQILPMLLLLSPLYSIVAYYFRHIDIKESENIAEHSVQTNNSSISPLNEFLLEKPAFKVVFFFDLSRLCYGYLWLFYVRCFCPTYS